MRTRFYAPCSGSCVMERIVGDDAIAGRVLHNAWWLHALFRPEKEKRHAMLPRGVCMLASRIACRQVVLPDPFICSLVGSIGFEPTTPTMSRWCSNQLSYEPKKPRIIERVFEEHKPLRENFLNRRA